MEIIHQEKAQQHVNGTLTAWEYPSKDKDINGAVTKIKGRYPQEGWGVNTECKELIYILEGSGTLQLKNEKVDLKTGDMLIIKPNEEYIWEGEMTHVVATTPPWNPKQHVVYA